ncbi:helix-turn-helix transcriptional regulator [Marinivivus vitaminiproducens]|uniref:helix-turn-helix transcriptional regulator n=1 Tax=Marinivivus vitaminiproducens TaxID=3035935 RepID=UPI0027A5AD8A|nr:S24 family peptidase [Geminicoccaceae bacterium SCSIO 64248]
MFTHAEVWRGIDRLARLNGLSPSALAKSAGLDATTFNPSKRHTKERKPRWPSTESLAKILDATGTKLSDFVVLMREEAGPPAPADHRRLPCLATGDLQAGEMFDASGFPKGAAWRDTDLPRVEDAHAFALKVSGGAWRPFYRDGDLLVLSPSASIRRHDRVLVHCAPDRFRIGQLVRRTAQRVEINDYEQPDEPLGLGRADIAWMVRIVWASQ